MLAHTGGEDEFPASTLFAFGESVKAGVDMLDLNINITKDDELVVQHDDTVDRNTDGTGAVRDLTYDEIARLDAAHWFSAACADCRDRPEGDYLYRGIRTGEQEPPAGYTADDFALPTLRQLVQRFPDIPLNIEIKGEGDIAKATADELAKQLKELGREQASVVASFQDDVVSYFHSIAPEVEVSPGLNVLTAYVLSSTPIPDGMRILQLPPEFSGIQVITPELVARATTDGNPIWVWPNNRDLENQASYADFLAQGIVGLNINFPAQGVQAVQQYVAASAVTSERVRRLRQRDPAPRRRDPRHLSAAGLDGTFIRHLPPAYDGATPLPHGAGTARMVTDGPVAHLWSPNCPPPQTATDSWSSIPTSPARYRCGTPLSTAPTWRGSRHCSTRSTPRCASTPTGSTSPACRTGR